MLKGKLVVLSLIAAALLCWQVMPASVDSANSGIVDPCSSSASSAGGCYVICPQGDVTAIDGGVLNNIGPSHVDATISVTVKDQTGAPVVGIPATDLWLVGWGDSLTLCGGAGSINASAATDVNGQTTITGVMSAGGCDEGVIVVVQGTVILDPADWVTPLCLPILVRSPDTNGDLDVELLDFNFFGNHWGAFGNPYDKCVDYNCDTVVDILDFTVFGNHWQHKCL